MTVTVEVPDELGGQLFAGGQEPSRAVLEALVLEGFRAERLSEYEVRQLLGFETGLEVHQFLKDHDTFSHYSLEDLQHDLAAGDKDAELVRIRRAAIERPGE